MPEAHSLVEDRGISVTSYDGYAPPLPSLKQPRSRRFNETQKKLSFCAKMLNKGDAAGEWLTLIRVYWSNHQRAKVAAKPAV